ncbi:MAG TPA: hypothetical protein VLT36_15170 [Candidatus Dormibacteraeota bacterium]|nr:hypothetical protein [Candidatus Dormibacteraeota bacterium]
MKTILRNARTGAYFQGPTDWTADASEAFDFKLPERALRFVKDARLRNVELVFAFDDPRYNVPLPVDERFGLTRSNRKAHEQHATA